MSFISICYRVVLKTARYYGWQYKGGIHITDKKINSRDTYLWKHKYGTYEEFETYGHIPNGVKQGEIHSILYTLKNNLQMNPLEDDYIDDLIATVREVNNLNEWDVYLKLEGDTHK